MKKLLSNKRGQIRVIEAFFAAILMLSSLTLIPAVQRSNSSPSSVPSSAAFHVLASLDSNGYLGTLVDQRNWSALQTCIEAFIPPAGWFNLTVFNENMTPINLVPICNGGAASDHIVAADYICPSTNANYTLYTLRLQLAGLD